MGRIVGIAFIVALIWLGLRIFTEGSDSVLALIPGYTPSESSERATAPLDALRERSRAAAQQQLERIENQLGKGETVGDESSGEDAQD